MVAQAPDRRTGRLAGAAGVALLLAGLTWLAEPASWRAPAVALLALGIVVGALAAMRLPACARPWSASTTAPSWSWSAPWPCSPSAWPAPGAPPSPAWSAGC